MSSETSAEEGVPDWWTPPEADPEGRRLYDPTVRVKHLSVERIGTALRRIHEHANDAGLTVSDQVDEDEAGRKVATGVDERRMVTTYYRWTVERDEEGIVATQERYFPACFRYVEASVPALLGGTITALWLGRASTRMVPVSAGALAVMILLFLAFIAFAIAANQGRDPFDGLAGKTQPVSSRMLSRVFVTGLAVLPVFFVSQIGWILPSFTTPEWLVNLGYAISVSLAVGATVVPIRLQYVLPPVPDFSTWLPAGGSEYIFVTAFAAAPLTVALAWTEGMIRTSIPVLIATLVVTGGLACSIVILIAVRGMEIVDSFQHGGLRYVSSGRVHLVITGAGTLLGWATFAAWTTVATQLPRILSTVHTSPDPYLALLAGLFVVALLPGLYVWSGLIAQSIGVGAAVARLVRCRLRADPAPAAVDDAVPAPVYVVPGRDRWATAFSLGPSTWILLGSGLLADLDPEEARAVAAHEFAHASVYQDTTLALLTPIIGMILLVGQNVLLGAFDYRKREFRADRYAARVTSPDAVVNALTKVSLADLKIADEERTRMDGRSVVGLLPTPAVVPGGYSRSPFSPLFDPICVVEAHPSVTERIEALRQVKEDSTG